MRLCTVVVCLLAAASAPNAAEPLSADAFHVVDDQLRGLVDTLLADNPAVAAARGRSRSALERVGQERALPDPLLTYRYFARTPETRVGPQEHQLELSQTLPWAGKRRLQGTRAERMAGGLDSEAEDVGRRAVADLKRAYFEAAYLQEALRVNGEEREMLRRFESIALRRYTTGQGIQQHVVKVQTEISRLEDRETDLRQRIATVSQKIAELIGRPEEPLVLAPIELPLPPAAKANEIPEASAVAEHPRVAALESRVASDRLWAERRKLESKPDFRLGLGYTSVGRREDLAGTLNPPEGNGKDVVALSVGVNLPVFRGRIRAGVAEARQSEQADRDQLAAVQDRLRFEIAEARLRADSLGQRGRLYDEVIVPQAEESLASAEAAYTTDRLGFLDLLDAERVLFQARLTYHRLVTDLWIALSDLELATAHPVPSNAEEGR